MSFKILRLSLKGGEKISQKNHKSAKKVFEIEDSPVEVVGFWAPKKMMGVYSHMGDRTHLHFVSNDKKHSGHVDDFNLYPGSEIFISIAEKN